MSTPTPSLDKKAAALWALGKSTKEVAKECGRSLRWAQVQVKGFKESYLVPLTVIDNRIVPLTIPSLSSKYVAVSTPCESQDQRHAIEWTTLATGRAYHWEAPDNDGTYQPVTELIKNDYVTTYTQGE